MAEKLEKYDMSDHYYQAQQMAKSGLGAEDIYARLGPMGLTQYEAEHAVFGKMIAMRREARRRNPQIERQVS